MATGNMERYRPVTFSIDILWNISSLRASGLGTALIKAYTEGNESTYFSVEKMTVSIAKVANTIILEDPGINGIYTLQVNADGCSSELSEQYVYVITGIDPVSEKEVLVYPVPFRDKLSISLGTKGSHTTKNQYSIADMTGKALIIGECEGDHIVLDLESLEPGLYILSVTRNHKSEFFRILKSM